MRSWGDYWDEFDVERGCFFEKWNNWGKAKREKFRLLLLGISLYITSCKFLGFTHWRTYKEKMLSQTHLVDGCMHVASLRNFRFPLCIWYCPYLSALISLLLQSRTNTYTTVTIPIMLGYIKYTIICVFYLHHASHTYISPCQPLRLVYCRTPAAALFQARTWRPPAFALDNHKWKLESIKAFICLYICLLKLWKCAYSLMSHKMILKL